MSDEKYSKDTLRKRIIELEKDNKNIHECISNIFDKLSELEKSVREVWALFKSQNKNNIELRENLKFNNEVLKTHGQLIPKNQEEIAELKEYVNAIEKIQFNCNIKEVLWELMMGGDFITAEFADELCCKLDNPTLGDGIPVDARFPSTDNKIVHHCGNCKHDGATCEIDCMYHSAWQFDKEKQKTLLAKLDVRSAAHTEGKHIFLNSPDHQMGDSGGDSTDDSKTYHPNQTTDGAKPPELKYKSCDYDYEEDCSEGCVRMKAIDEEERVRDATRQEIISEFVNDLKSLNENDWYDFNMDEIITLKKKWEEKLK